jgi:hypothetical protein
MGMGFIIRIKCSLHEPELVCVLWMRFAFFRCLMFPGALCMVYMEGSVLYHGYWLSIATWLTYVCMQRSQSILGYHIALLMIINATSVLEYFELNRDK